MRVDDVKSGRYSTTANLGVSTASLRPIRGLGLNMVWIEGKLLRKVHLHYHAHHF